MTHNHSVSFSWTLFQETAQTFKSVKTLKKAPNTRHILFVEGQMSDAFLDDIQAYFEFDHTVKDDLLNPRQRTKMEFKNSHIFATIHTLYLKEETVKQGYVSLVLYEDNLMVVDHHRSASLRAIFETLLTEHDVSMDHFFYRLLDTITDHFLAVFKFCNDEALSYEETLLEANHLNQEEFYRVRKNILRLKMIAEPLLDDFEKMRTLAPHLLKTEHHLYFDDLKDHLIRLLMHVNETREMMRHLLDLNLNNQSQKMNRIMTTLTLFSAIFIPLSFLTGFFGMNFVHFDVLEYEYALIGFIVGCAFLAVGMVLLFKKMRWFD